MVSSNCCGVLTLPDKTAPAVMAAIDVALHIFAQAETDCLTDNEKR